MPHYQLNNVVSAFILTLLGLGTQGFIFFYYLNNLKNINCDCVSDTYHEKIKQYFQLTLLGSIIFYSCKLLHADNIFIIVAAIFSLFSKIKSTLSLVVICSNTIFNSGISFLSL